MQIQCPKLLIFTYISTTESLPVHWSSNLRRRFMAPVSVGARFPRPMETEKEDYDGKRHGILDKLF